MCSDVLLDDAQIIWCRLAFFFFWMKACCGVGGYNPRTGAARGAHQVSTLSQLVNNYQHENNTSGSPSYVPHKLLRNEINRWSGIYNPMFTTAKHLKLTEHVSLKLLKVTACRDITRREPVISGMRWRWTAAGTAHASACAHVLCACRNNEADSAMHCRTWRSSRVHVGFVRPRNESRERECSDYQSGGLIWFNAVTQSSTLSAISGPCVLE